MLLTATFICSATFLLFGWSPVLASNAVDVETYRIPHDAPPGWLAVDLASNHRICSSHARISLEHSKYSHLFHISSLCRLTTNGDLSDLAGLNIPVTVVSSIYDSDTPITAFVYLLIEIQDLDSIRFENTVYATEITATTSTKTVLEFIRPIQLNDPQRKVEFELKNSTIKRKPLISVSTRINDFGKRFAEVALTRNASHDDSLILHRFYITAVDAGGKHVANARIEIVVRPSVPDGSTSKSFVTAPKRKPSKPIRHRRDHRRRDLGNDIIIELFEGHPRGMLEQKIRLFGDERVILAPVVKDQLSIGSDGSIELIGELDYEKMTEIVMSVQIEDGYGNARIQTVLVDVLDIDEPPVFLNVPRPYLAVVPYSRPIGFQVYKFSARDELGLGDADVEYRLINTEPPGMFVVDAKSGAVRTAAKKYTPGETYQVFVQARDRTPSGNDTNVSQDSEIAVLEIYAGDRPPQFFEAKYEISVPEDTEVQNSVVKIETHRFKPIDEYRVKSPLRYSLYSESNGPDIREPSSFFDINPDSGVVILKQPLDRDDPSQAKLHKLSVVASEDGKESTVPLEITVEDVNDNVPTFSQPLYTASTREDIGLGEVILKVHADDKDSGLNAELVYSLDDRNFTINEKGEISARTRLDADQHREKFFIYRFTVTVTDKGNPPLQGHAQVHIRTENTNDEAPMFMPTRQYTAFVAEDAQGGTPVLQVQAIEPDRDQITYGFVDRYGRESEANELFEIDSDTGLIRLKPNVESEDLLKVQSPYNLTVYARDDGSCCGFTPGDLVHTQTATVLIGIADVNNNKPEFRDCESYSQQARIEEGIYRSNPPTIIRVVATDEDSSPNGDIVYSLYYARSQSRKPFTIDPDTGELRPSPHVVFDREQRAYEEVTVKATDKGDRPLIGFCQFTVQVVDVNDNAPQFDRASYETSISRAARPLTSVLSVYADDSDAPQNAQIFYSILPDESSGVAHADDHKYFKIMNVNNGEITLVKPIPKDKSKFLFNVLASDNGFPDALNSTVQVTVNVHEKQQSAPQWQTSNGCKQNVVVDENLQINSVLFRCHAIAGGTSNNPISYKMTNGVKRGTNIEQKFREFMEKKDGRDWVVVKNMESLDYEQTRNYTLTITATDMRTQVTADKQFNVLVRDMNDAVPRFTVDRFTGTIDEELTPAEFLQKSNGKPITTVKAEDADSFGPQSDIRYRILGDSRYFRIDEISGGIFPLEKFDRETTDTFILDVEARDSMPSSLPGADGPNKDIVKVQIFIADVNDNPPYFKQKRYEASVPENTDVDTDIITVKADDLDKHSTLKYNILTTNGGRLPFGVRTDSGAVYVKEPLDFEKQQEYRIRVHVTDGKHNASTNLDVRVTDINDNAPQFVQNRYETTINEEESNVPKVLFKLKATDADQDEKSKKIIYRLEGQGVGEYFSVQRETGEVSVLKALDRDPPYGVPVWKFVAQAVDDDGRGLIGYADVQVNLQDINDNAPIFPNDMFGKVDENREPGKYGVYVMTASATDYDDPRSENSKLEYSISVNKEIDQEPVFRIDANNGKIFAMRKLDRELSSERQFVIEVRATDKGVPPREGAGNVTITVVDVNDNYPYFEKPSYFGTVPETVAVGSAVLSVSALDDDNEAKDNLFTYELVDKNNEFFYMTTDADSSSSTVGVIRVKKPLDFEDPSQRNGFPLDVRVFDGRYYATTHVVLQLEDRNDNSPKIYGPSRLEVREDARYRHLLAKLKVEDADANDTATFRIDRTTDPKRQFSIDQNGNLYTAQRLDREEFQSYKLGIEAYDANGNVGRLGVEITVTDINDNAPVPYTLPYPCIFMENTDPQNQPTCEIRAYDRDERQNGPPFTMEVGPDFKYGNYLSVTFDQTGDNGNGSMTVKALQRFDRESEFPGKQIPIPVIITDNGGLRSERDVYIIIGDQNDNPMHDGRMQIHVNSYLGRLEKTMIGRVYVEDKDDWDQGDKEYSWQDKLPGFSLAPNGDITMDGNMNPGTYELVAKVVDRKRNEEARGWVKVVVSKLPESAFQNQGSLRILMGPGGYASPSDFLQVDDNGESPMTRFKQALEGYLNGATPIVIFSVKQDKAELQTDNIDVVDVRFAAHRDSERNSVLLNGLVAQHKADIEKLIGAPIVSVGIDMCKFTLCDNGCQTENSADFTGVVVSANRTVLVGVNAYSKDKCYCPVFDPPPQCEPGVCYNQGVCHNTHPGFFCECRNSLLKGFRCQGTTRSFDGAGFAWFKPMPACTSLNITFQFMTKEPNAMLLFNGPMGRNSSAQVVDYGDYVSMQLIGGVLSVDLNFNGRTPTHLEIPKSPKLNDGKWHTVALTQIGRSLELVLDSCVDLMTSNDDVPEDSACRRTIRTVDDDERLNIVAPLQIGGVAPLSGELEYPGIVSVTNGLKGCMRNLYVNNDQYDLATPAMSVKSKEGCGYWGSACETNSIESLNYCVHGDCYADSDAKVPKCVCDPGYAGDRCDKSIEWVEFAAGGMISYNVKVELMKQVTEVGVLFIPGKANAGSGQLGYGTNPDKGSVSTYIENYAPRADFDVMKQSGAVDQVKLSLNQLRLHDNTSYWMQFDRNPTRASLAIDGIYHTSEVLNPYQQAFLLSINDIQLGAGSFAHGFRGCVGTYRWDHNNLPLTKPEVRSSQVRHLRSVQEEEIISIKDSTGVQQGCSIRATCASLGAGFCTDSYVCVDFWKGPFCTCPEGARTLINDKGELQGCSDSLAVSSLGVSTSTIIIIMASLLALILLMMMILLVSTRSTKQIASDVRPEDMKRDNLRPYDVEGGGEADNTRHNIAGLRKPVMPIDGADIGPVKTFPTRPIDDKLNSRINDLETDPNTGPYDELRMYNTEGDNVSRLTLDSLESASDETPSGAVDQDTERWGPRFNDYGHRE